MGIKFALFHCDQVEARAAFLKSERIKSSRHALTILPLSILKFLGKEVLILPQCVTVSHC